CALLQGAAQWGQASVDSQQVNGKTRQNDLTSLARRVWDVKELTARRRKELQSSPQKNQQHSSRAAAAATSCVVAHSLQSGAEISFNPDNNCPASNTSSRQSRSSKLDVNRAAILQEAAGGGTWVVREERGRARGSHHGSAGGYLQMCGPSQGASGHQPPLVSPGRPRPLAHQELSNDGHGEEEEEGRRMKREASLLLQTASCI
ncbi:unnamed protein product, partial [Pleuronectes platessa]